MKICFCDLDGVLVNAVKGFLDLFDKPDPYENSENLGKFDILPFLDLTPEEFWPKLNYDFWRNLEWMPDGHEILQKIESAFDEVVILSSPCRTHGCCDGKKDWIAEHLPKYKSRFFLGTAKHAVSLYNTCLVDDKDENVHLFNAKDGKGILVPRKWNSLHEMSEIDAKGYLSQQILSY